MFDFHVHSISDELLANAKLLGYKALGVLNSPLPAKSPLPLLRGLEISPRNSQHARSLLKASCDYSLMHSTSVELARSCGKLVDIFSLDLTDLIYDHVIASFLKDSFVEFDLSSILFSERRMRAMSALSKALAIARKSDNRILISLCPLNQWHLRSSSDMRDLLEFLDFSKQESKQALIENPKALLELISGRNHSSYVKDGVKTV